MASDNLVPEARVTYEPAGGRDVGTLDAQSTEETGGVHVAAVIGVAVLAPHLFITKRVCVFWRPLALIQAFAEKWQQHQQQHFPHSFFCSSLHLSTFTQSHISVESESTCVIARGRVRVAVPLSDHFTQSFIANDVWKMRRDPKEFI